MIQQGKNEKLMKIPRGSALARRKFYKVKFGRVNSAWFSGFTLIEILVVLAIFGLLVSAMVGIFISGINSQRKAFALQSTQENIRYATETMAKEIRMSVVNSAAGESAVLSITNPQGQTFDYSFDAINKKLVRNGQFISPAGVEVTGKFYVTKGEFPLRAKVSVAMSAEIVSTKAEKQANIDLQTTITARASQ